VAKWSIRLLRKRLASKSRTRRANCRLCVKGRGLPTFEYAEVKELVGRVPLRIRRGRKENRRISNMNRIRTSFKKTYTVRRRNVRSN